MAGAPAPKRRRYSLEPDLDIEVDGQVFQVNSFPVMQASPVFRAMLEGDMKEAQEGRITLPHKSKEEFRQVLPFLSGTHQTPQVTTESVHVLLQWAQEYDIESLRAACEKELLLQPAGSVEALQMAVNFKLLKRAAQCGYAVSADICKHMQEVEKVADEPAAMELLWPSLFEAAGLAAPKESLHAPSVRQLWPFMQKAITAEQSTKLFELSVKVPRTGQSVSLWVLHNETIGSLKKRLADAGMGTPEALKLVHDGARMSVPDSATLLSCGISRTDDRIYVLHF